LPLIEQIDPAGQRVERGAVGLQLAVHARDLRRQVGVLLGRHLALGIHLGAQVDIVPVLRRDPGPAAKDRSQQHGRHDLADVDLRQDPRSRHRHAGLQS
jgi:hypothetical protein